MSVPCPVSFLGDVAETNPETLRASTDPTFEFRYIDLSAVSDGCIDWNAVTGFTYSTAPSRARRLVRPGDVLFGTVRPALRSHGYIDSYSTPTPLVASTGFSVVRAKAGKSHPRYLFHALLSDRVRLQAEKHAVGSNYPAVNDGDVRRLTIFTPRIEEQAKVAEILDALDIAIRQTEAVIEKLKQVKQGLLHDLLTRGIGENGELRLPQSEAPHLYKQSELGWIPEEWQVNSLRELVTAPICYGIVQVGKHLPTGVPVVAIRDLETNFRGEMNRTDPRIDAQYTRSRVIEGDVLLSIKGTVGRVGVVPGEFVGNISREIARIRPRRDLDSEFLCHLLRSATGQRLLSWVQVGTTRAEFSIGPLKQLRFPIPNPHEQRSMRVRIYEFDRSLRTERDNVEKCRQVKRALMDDLLTGRVRIASR